MATRGGTGGAVDRISGLPDDLLYSILIRLPTTADAARTSLLSRRWRRVWTRIPFLVFLQHDVSADSQGKIDAALDECTAPAIDGLAIVLRNPPVAPTAPLQERLRRHPRIPGHRISAWLRFAAQRVTGSLHLEVPYAATHIDDGVPYPLWYIRQSSDREKVVLPMSDRAKVMFLSLSYHKLELQIMPLSGGAFTELGTLIIANAHMDSQELQNVVSSCCPQLKVLKLGCGTLHGGSPSGFSMQSDSVEELWLNISLTPEEGRIRVTAPKLKTLFANFYVDDVYISAPMLSELHWNVHQYDPSKHRIADAKSHLHRLDITTNCPAVELMRRFHTVHELSLQLEVPRGVEGYKSFLMDVSKLSRCEVLVVDVGSVMPSHALKPVILSLLRKCADIRKLVLLCACLQTPDYFCEASGCPCGCPENSKMDGIVLGSLEEVEVRGECGKEDRKLELVKLLYKLSGTSQKKVAITVNRGTPDMREKIHSICPPNNKVEIRFRMKGELRFPN